MVYLIINFTVTKVCQANNTSGSEAFKKCPPYSILDWNSVLGWLLPFGLIIGAVIFMYGLYFLNNWKLNQAGYGDVVKVIEGYEIVVETEEDVFGREGHFGSVNDPGNLTHAIGNRPKQTGGGRAGSV